MKIGIYGVHYEVHVGGMIRTAEEASNAEIVGLVEPDDALYQKYSKDGVTPRYDSLGDLVHSGGAEIILEGVNHEEKPGLIEACGRLGVHCVMDKPLCRTVDELERIRRVVKDTDIRLSMFFTSRNYPPFIALREAILDGQLGEVVSLVTTHPHKLGDFTPDFYFDPNRYTGTFHDLACHGVDQVLWLTGQHAVAVHALGTLVRKSGPRTLQYDHVQASFELSNGALAVATADWLTPQSSPSFGDTRFIVMGTEGSAHLRAYAEDGLLVCSNENGRYEPSLPESRNARFIQDLVSAYERGEEDLVTTEEVLTVAHACIAAETSAKLNGKLVEIH